MSLKSSQSNFKSLKMAIEEYHTDPSARQLDNPSDTLYEDYGLLPEILNEDKIVKIGEHLIKVDLHSETVAVLPVSNQEQYDDLVNDNYDNENIMLFSTEDEVLEMLDEGYYSNGRSQLFCRDRKPKGEMEKVRYYYYSDPVAQYDYRVLVKHGYQKAGIYFSLMTKLKHGQRRSGAGTFTPYATAPTTIPLDWFHRFKKRCRSSHDQDSGSKYENWDNKLSRRHYEGTRRLARFWIKSKFLFL